MQSRTVLFMKKIEIRMKRSHHVVMVAECLLLLVFPCSGFAQQPAQQAGQGARGAAPPVRDIGVDNRRLTRPPLFFSEAWKQTNAPGQRLITADAVSNPNLELKFYGPLKDGELNGVAGDENNPIRIWMGLCGTPFGAALRDKNNFVVLRGLANVRWVT